MEAPIKCPRCHSGAFNKNGKTIGGKQRFICLVCNRQFVSDSPQIWMDSRPLCPVCGKKMHVYRTDKDFTRYRCSNYPTCRGFARVLLERDSLRLIKDCNPG